MICIYKQGGVKKIMGTVRVITYEGENSTFIWKYPKEDFNSLSQLSVHESQEASIKVYI